MVGKVVQAAGITIALFEVLGFLYLESQLSVIGIPANLTGLQIFELPRWGLEALNNEIPGPAIFVLVVLAWCSLMAFIFDQIGGPVRVVRSLEGGSIRTWTSLAFVEVQLGFREQIPMIQVTCASVLVFWSVIWFGLQGAKSSNSLMAAVPPMFVQRFHVRYSIRLDAVPGRTFPDGIRSENSDGSLVLLWQDAETLYVAARRCEIHQDSLHAFLIWFAIPRADVSSMKFTRMWDFDPGSPLHAAKMSTKQRSGEAIQQKCETLIRGLHPVESGNWIWALCAVGVASCSLLAYASLRAFKNDNSREASLSKISCVDGRTVFLRGNLPFVRTIYSILARGKDVEVSTLYKGNVVIRELLRHADFDTSIRCEVVDD